MNWLRQRKHSLLLTLLVAGLLLQPVAGIAVELAGYVMILGVFVVVFERRWEQGIGLALGIPAIVASALGHLTLGTYQLPVSIAAQIAMIVFLSFAIVRILADILQTRAIALDDVIGAFSGFVLVGLVWGRLYLLIDGVLPNSFHIQADITGNLQDLQLRRFLFNHFSFAMLTPMDPGGVAPATPFVRTLTWAEALFGQFYLAVFIGQLVGARVEKAERAAG
jgi:hypothetical protein